MVMRFPAKKNAGCPKAPCDFPPRKDGILCPRRVVLGLPSPSHRVCGRTDVRMYGRTDGRSRDYYVTTKISRIDRLPYFLSNGAPLAGFARRLRYNFDADTLLLMLSNCFKVNYVLMKILYYLRKDK